jgi:hypothetical protein
LSLTGSAVCLGDQLLEARVNIKIGEGTWKA